MFRKFSYTNVKKIFFGKKNGTESALYFLSRTPIHNSFSFNLAGNYMFKVDNRNTRTKV